MLCDSVNLKLRNAHASEHTICKFLPLCYSSTRISGGDESIIFRLLRWSLSEQRRCNFVIQFEIADNFSCKELVDLSLFETSNHGCTMNVWILHSGKFCSPRNKSCRCKYELSLYAVTDFDVSLTFSSSALLSNEKCVNSGSQRHYKSVTQLSHSSQVKPLPCNSI